MPEPVYSVPPDQPPLTIGASESVPLLRPPSKSVISVVEPQFEPHQRVDSLQATSVKKPPRRATASRVPLAQRLRLPGRREDYTMGGAAAAVSIVIGVAIASFLK